MIAKHKVQATGEGQNGEKKSFYKKLCQLIALLLDIFSVGHFAWW
jgi:hypothetical protein